VRLDGRNIRKKDHVVDEASDAQYAAGTAQSQGRCEWMSTLLRNFTESAMKLHHTGQSAAWNASFQEIIKELV